MQRVGGVVFRALARLRPALLAMLLIGCAQYPLGMSEDEFLALTPDQQLAARQQQAELDALAARERIARQEAEARRIEALYAQAGPTDVVQCVLEDGEIAFWGNFKGYQPTGFTLVRTEQRAVPVHSGYGSRELYAGLSADGQTLSICDDDWSFPHGHRCGQAAFLNRDLVTGIRQPFAVTDTVDGATLRCAYAGTGRYRHRS